MFIHDGLTLSHDIFSILVTTSFLLVPYQYAIICVLIILFVILGWKYNNGRCFIRAYELHTKDSELEELSLDKENNLYQSFQKMGYEMSYENFDTSVNIILLCCCLILLYRYIYKINFIPYSDLTSNLYAFIFFMVNLFLFLFLFSSMYMYHQTKSNPKLIHIALIFLLLYISCSIYVFYS